MSNSEEENAYKGLFGVAHLLHSLHEQLFSDQPGIAIQRISEGLLRARKMEMPPDKTDFTAMDITLIFCNAPPCPPKP